MEKYMNSVSVIFGLVGGFAVGWLGGMDTILHTLMVVVIVDYITGLMKGWKLQQISSRIGFNGLLKKILIFIVVGVAVELEKILGNAIPLREVVIMFYLANEGISFLENVSVFIPLPEKLRTVFMQIRDKGGNE